MRPCTFGAVVGGLGEETLAVIGAFEPPLDASAEPDVVFALRGRDGETALLVHGQVRVRVRVLAWQKRVGEMRGKKVRNGRKKTNEEVKMWVQFSLLETKRSQQRSRKYHTEELCVSVLMFLVYVSIVYLRLYGTWLHPGLWHQCGPGFGPESDGPRGFL